MSNSINTLFGYTLADSKARTEVAKKIDKPAVEGTEGQVLSKSADGSNVWVDLSIEEDNLNTMLTNVFGFVSEN